MTRIAVCVPARNEGENLGTLVSALHDQLGLDGLELSICFYFDGADPLGAAEVVRSVTLCRWPIFTEFGERAWPPNAGAARARSAALACYFVGADDFLLSTDADSVPASDWVARCVSALRKADVVAGRIVRRQDSPCKTLSRVEAYLDRLYSLRRQLDPVEWETAPGHHQNGGANLGFRVDAYQALGGFEPLPCDEDVGIVTAAARAGYRVARDPTCVVTTSDRRTGRAVGGLADALARLDRDGDAVEVDHPGDEIERYRRQAIARRAFEGGAPQRAAAALDRTEASVLAVAQSSRNAEAFANRLVEPPAVPRRIGIADAERLLDRALGTIAAVAA